MEVEPVFGPIDHLTGWESGALLAERMDHLALRLRTSSPHEQYQYEITDGHTASSGR